MVTPLDPVVAQIIPLLPQSQHFAGQTGRFPSIGSECGKQMRGPRADQIVPHLLPVIPKQAYAGNGSARRSLLPIEGVRP